MKFKIPSKTFMLGEYVALCDGPALLLSHGPYYEVEFLNSTDGDIENPFHPESPAGIWMDMHDEIFENVDIRFTDPYDGAGGFGASTAQFIAAYLFVLYKNKVLREQVTLNSIQKWAIVEDYRNLFEGQKVLPSGYDLIAQLGSGLQSICAKTQTIESVAWPFTFVDVTVYKTPSKVATHKHLAKVDLQGDAMGLLEQSVSVGLKALKDKNQQGFLAAIQQFSQIQRDHKFLSEEAKNLTDRWSENKDVLSARGCGALGTDVLMTFTSKNFVPSADLEKGLTKIYSLSLDTQQSVSLSMENLSGGPL